MWLLLALLKLLALGGLYFFALYHYAPSDVMNGAWVYKPAPWMIFARIFGLLVLYRIIKFVFFSAGKPLFIRLFSALFALPFYAMIAALLVLSINGHRDDFTRTTEWRTNLVFFRDFKMACLVAGIDDYQIRRRDNTAQLVLLSGKHCKELADDEISSESLMPYRLEISNGAFSIPYIIAVEKLL